MKNIFFINAIVVLLFTSNTIAQTSNVNISSFITVDTIYYNNPLKTYLVRKHIGSSVIIYKEFYSDSLILSEYTTIDGKVSGTMINYHKNGTIQTLQTFINDVPVGPFIKYYENGNVLSYYDYGYDESDIFLNEEVMYYEEASETPPFHYTGYVKTYYKKINGNMFFFLENGKIMRIESYSDDIPHGIWQYFNDEGKLIKEETYVNDELIETKLH